MGNVVEIKDFSFSYSGSDEFALEDINLRIEEGSINLLIGKSGSGKSTLLKCLKTGMMPAGRNSGKILIGSSEVGEMSQLEATKTVGLVTQNPDNQIVTDTVWHELAFGLENLGVSNNSIRSRVAEMAEYFGISDWYNKKVTSLSGGQKQLLNLASVMVTTPSILLLDEPTAQLDPIATKRFLGQIAAINADLGTTIIMIEHNLENIYEKVDKIVALENGKVLATGDKSTMISKLRELESNLTLGLPKAVRVYEKLSEKTDRITVPQVRKWIKEYFVDMPTNIRKDVEKYLREQDPNINTDKKISPIITIKDVSFYYNDNMDKSKKVLNNLNLQINEGEITAILGGNGAGKSTLLKLLTNIEKAKSGKIKVAKNKRIYMLPQNPLTVFTQISVEEELAEIILLRSDLYKELDLEKKKELVYESLKNIGLESCAKRHPYDLSGGEAQKLAIAKIMLMKPEILLLDEPTKGLDPFYRQEIGDMLKKLVDKEGITVVVVTHDLEWTARYANKCALLFDGEVASLNNTRDFFAGNMFFTTGVNRVMSDIFNNCIVMSDVEKIKKLSKDW